MYCTCVYEGFNLWARFCDDMMLILLRVCLILPWTVAAPLKELMEDDGVGRDGMHSHTSLNREERVFVHGGDIDFSGSIASSKDYGEINIGSIFNKAASQEHQPKEPKSVPEVQELEQEEVFSCSFNDEQLAVPEERDGQLSPHDISASYKWENNLIPYFFTSTNDKDKDLFRNIMALIEEKTCFKFKEKTKAEYEDKHSLEIEANGYSCENGCSGHVTADLNTEVVKLKSNTQVNDREVCEVKCGGFILHELMHALGVGHTQKRKDRDEYILINEANLKDSVVAEQFKICTHCNVYDEIPYDCDSIMHYPTHYGGKELYSPKDPNKCRLNTSKKVDRGPKGSDLDWQLLNIIGNCPKCVTSPGFPLNYPDNFNTAETISVKDGQAIEITFDDFDVEFQEMCYYDYLRFIDANGNAVGEEMCGSDFPKKLTILTSTASVLFVSDRSVNKMGYKFCYESLKCVTSPGYPNHYPHNYKTNQIFSVADGHKIEITFHHFDVEFQEYCSYDYLQFMDENGKTVGKQLCGQSLPDKLTIPTSSASAYFSSDGSETKKGYMFCYKPV